MKKIIALFVAMFMMACSNTETTATPHDLDNTDTDDTTAVQLQKDTNRTDSGNLNRQP
ncbi:MAG TPA: hypothetical protein VFZ78_10330 [Flavisolibacter sp.]